MVNVRADKNAVQLQENVVHGAKLFCDWISLLSNRNAATFKVVIKGI